MTTTADRLGVTWGSHPQGSQRGADVEAPPNWIDREDRRSMAGRLLALAFEIETVSDDNLAEVLEHARRTLRLSLATIS